MTPLQTNQVFKIRIGPGLGDALLMTPLFPALKKKYPASKTHVFCHPAYCEIFLHNPDIDMIRAITLFRKTYLRFSQHISTRYAWCFPSLGHRKPSEIVAEQLGITVDSRRLHFYLTAAEDEHARKFLKQYPNPVAIHTTSLCCPNQMWPIENWNALVRAMPDFTFLQLGVESETAVAGTVDMRGKTSFRQAVALLKHSLCFAGVVSSMAHASNAVATPGVVFYGPSSSRVWGHDNLICLDRRLRCAPCVDLLLRNRCPYDRECMTGISVDEVKHAILKQAGTSAATTTTPQPVVPIA